IWINDSPGRSHWLEIRLEGARSNRDGIGARIRVAANGRAQYDQLVFASGYASASAGPAHFGLGAAAAAEAGEGGWRSVAVKKLKNVAADRIVRIREPER